MKKPKPQSSLPRRLAKGLLFSVRRHVLLSSDDVEGRTAPGDLDGRPHGHQAEAAADRRHEHHVHRRCNHAASGEPQSCSLRCASLHGEDTDVLGKGRGSIELRCTTSTGIEGNDSMSLWKPVLAPHFILMSHDSSSPSPPTIAAAGSSLVLSRRRAAHRPEAVRAAAPGRRQGVRAQGGVPAAGNQGWEARQPRN